jgi:hypothetical protein
MNYMKEHSIKFFMVILIAFYFSGCSKDDNSVNPPNGILVWSTSFEKDGFFSTEGWTLPSNSDSSTDVPAEGGKYSLLLESNSPPEVFAEIKVPVMTQYSDYKLSLWSYSTGITNDVNGKAVLSLLRNGSVVKSQSVLIDASVSWYNYTIEDTFSVTANDSFLVQLSGGVSQLLPGKTFFDLIKLEAIE